MPSPEHTVHDGPAPPDHRQRLDTAPAHRIRLVSGQSAWLVTRHADARSVLSDPRFSSDIRHPGFPLSRAAAMESVPPAAFMVLDPPLHTRYREPLAREFTNRRIARMTPQIEAIVDGCLAAMAEGPRPADLVRQFALPVTSSVICRLLGVPYSAAPVFQEHGQTVLSTRAGTDEVAAANVALAELIGEQIVRKRADPSDDLLSRLVADQDARELTDDDVVTTAVVLLTAGFESAAGTIAMGTLALLDDRAQWERLAADRSVATTAVDEILRHQTVLTNGVARVATADVDLDGTRIAAGDGVIVSLAAANRDPAAFPQPDRLDVGRGERGHVAFGHGVHHCLGHALARIELAVAFAGLARTFPGLRLAVPRADLVFRDDLVVHRPDTLPVTW